MRVLLDSHALIWSYIDDQRLSVPAKAAILDPKIQKLVSPASYWEIAIKVGLKKYTLSETYQDFVQHAIFDNGFEILSIEPKHTAALIGLPNHHRDPFDRLLIAQAQIEGVPLVSCDTVFDNYPVSRLW